MGIEREGGSLGEEDILSDLRVQYSKLKVKRGTLLRRMDWELLDELNIEAGALILKIGRLEMKLEELSEDGEDRPEEHRPEEDTTEQGVDETLRSNFEEEFGREGEEIEPYSEDYEEEEEEIAIFLEDEEI